jgi:hypothetical protein
MNASIQAKDLGPLDHLSAAQVKAFHDDGFLIVHGFFDPQEMADIANWSEEVEAWPEIPGKYMMYFEQSQLQGFGRILSRMENFAPYHAGFDRLFGSDKLRGSVGQLFGEEALLFKDKINFKMPGGDGFKPHQDVQAGWNRYGALHISALITIDEATVENGCLELVAGHHRAGMVGDSWAPLTDEHMQGMELVAVPTKPGDVVLFDSYAPHASKPNLTNQRRRLLYVTYGKASDGDQREKYYADKRASYPPDCERESGKEYVFRV